jgi:hypothetical protein
MSEIEKDFDALTAEMDSKMDKVIFLLKEINTLSQKAGFHVPMDYSRWSDLQEALYGFVDLDQGWNDSGCSF